MIQQNVPAHPGPTSTFKAASDRVRAMRRIALLAILFCGFLAGGPSTAQELPPTPSTGWQATLPDGIVNWTAGTARASGQSEPAGKSVTNDERRLALDHAITIARRNLFTTVMALPVAHGRTVSHTVNQAPAMIVKLKDTIDAAGVIDTVYLSDGTVRVTVEISLREGLAQLLLPSNIQPIDRIRSSTVTGSDPMDDPCPSGTATVNHSGPHTGLIIDARHTKALPSMAFSIHDETGRIVYGAAFVSREHAVQHGMGQYWPDFASANTSKRVCPRPLVIRALRVAGSGQSDFVISAADAGRLISDAEHVTLLRECRVAVILPPKPPARSMESNQDAK